MDKKELILKSALRLFVLHGFHGTPTSKIALEAGVATGTLFQYFKTKDELVISLYIHLKEDLKEYIAANTDSNKGLKEEIRSQILSSLYWALDNQAEFLFIQQFHTSPYLSKIEKAILQEQSALHLSLIKKGIDHGLLKSIQPDLIYLLISNHVFGLFQFLMNLKLTKKKQEATIHATFEMLWEMISTKK